MRTFVPIGNNGTEFYGKDHGPTEMEPGDFILVHHANKLPSKIIRFGQRLRIHGKDRKYCHWNHAALIVSRSGDLVEALGRGISETNIAEYSPKEYVVVKTGATHRDRKQIIKYARRQVGTKYGFFTIISIALSLLTGAKLSFGVEGQHICSGLVARSLERGEAIFSRSVEHVMPADLAKYYQVEIPK